MGEVVASTEAVVEVTTNLLLPLPVEAMDVEEVDIDHLLHMMEDVRVDLVEEEVRRTKLSCYTYTKLCIARHHKSIFLSSYLVHTSIFKILKFTIRDLRLTLDSFCNSSELFRV